MNTISLNTAAKAPASKAIEGGAHMSPEDRDNPSAFANALKDQETWLKDDPKTKIEQPAPQQTVEKQPANSEQTDSAANDGQALAALLEKYLPPFTDDSAAQAAAPDMGTALPVTTADAPAVPVDNPPPAAILMPQDTAGIVPTAPSYPKTLAEGVALKTPEESALLPTAMPKIAAFSQMQADPGIARPVTDNGESFKQALTAQGAGEQKIAEIATEMMAAPKLVEARAENLSIPRPMSHTGWNRDLGEHILWLVNKEITAAEIKLNPARLGPIAVRIDMSQDNQASILFAAQHAETKEALEAALPKLREMLQGQQLNLVNVNISQNPGSNQQGQHQAKPFAGAPGSPHNLSLETAPDASEVSGNDALISKGLLSLYA